MARCEDCIHNEICERFAGLRTLVCGYKAEERCKMFKPTADVVPKSEVHESVEKLMSATDKVICEAKREVAMEIFDEIDSMIFGTIIPNDCAIISIASLSELKKKYTEDQT